jgi:hypothetical protein
MDLGASNRNRYLARVGLDGEGTVIRAQGIARYIGAYLIEIPRFFGVIRVAPRGLTFAP